MHMKLPVVGMAHEAEAGAAEFNWFIYGSSLDRDAFADWAGQHGYRLPDFSRAVPARLDGWRLSFDVMSNFWGGAVASLREAPDGHVEGIALPLPAEARGLVDHKEGAISGLYEPFEVKVSPLAGGEPVPALAYRAAAARRLAQETTPSRRFVEVVLRGATAWGLDADYLDGLRGRLSG
jgi:hypothetical protein